MTEPFVISIILNTNRREDTLACLASLTASSYPHHKAIVLDNHSTDGSMQAISSAFPEVYIIELSKNLGYAGNNNVGIKEAIQQGADWVCVLNEDTILDRECLSRLLDVGRSDPTVGIIGPMVYHFNEPEIIQSAGGTLSDKWEGGHLGKNETDRGQFPNPHQVDWISGCAIMVRREVIEQVGPIDARFFYYWEETEWCVRTSRAGWKIVHVPGAKLWHKGVQRNYQPKPSLLYYDTRNHLLLLTKHRAPARAWFNTWFQIFRTLISWTINPKWRSMSQHRDAMWRGLLDFLRRKWGQMPS
jgi:hypothetical protein